jgi:histidyl-tRNA synthetase
MRGNAMLTSAPKGTKDVLPGESRKWQYIEAAMRDVCATFGYCEIRTPAFEHTELFLRGVGSTTDIVQKEMYTFEDKGGRSVTLKPEGTAGVARAFIEHGLFNQPLPAKMYYLYSPVFRYENPQAGRLREHHQFGVEAFGASAAAADAEIISLALTLLGRLGLKNLEVNVNSIGCPDCRPAYNARLREYLAGQKEKLCELCRDRLERNPLRVLDCKEEGCRRITAGAPHMLDNLCPECAAHFGTLKNLLDSMKVVYRVNPSIVRGLDYYTKTVFEIISPDIGAQSTVCGGGRYDGLIEEVGGPKTAAVGFGMGMERLLMALEARGLLPDEEPVKPVYVATMGERAGAEGFRLAMELRGRGIPAECDLVGRSFKAQFKYADKLGCRYVVIAGDDEIASGVWKIRDMASSSEEAVARDEIPGRLAGKE